MLASLSAIGLFFVIGAGPSSIVAFAMSSVYSLVSLPILYCFITLFAEDYFFRQMLIKKVLLTCFSGKKRKKTLGYIIFLIKKFLISIIFCNFTPDFSNSCAEWAAIDVSVFVHKANDCLRRAGNGCFGIEEPGLCGH